MVITIREIVQRDDVILMFHQTIRLFILLVVKPKGMELHLDFSSSKVASTGENRSKRSGCCRKWGLDFEYINTISNTLYMTS